MISIEKNPSQLKLKKTAIFSRTLCAHHNIVGQQNLESIILLCMDRQL